MIAHYASEILLIFAFTSTWAILAVMLFGDVLTHDGVGLKYLFTLRLSNRLSGYGCSRCFTRESFDVGNHILHSLLIGK